MLNIITKAHTFDNGRTVMPLRPAAKTLPKPPVRAVTRDVATKTLVATFKGSNYVAERVGDELQIFMLTSEPLTSVNVEGVSETQDKRRTADSRVLISLNKIHNDFWK